MYKIDNRPKKHRGRYTVLGIVLGIIFTIGGIYVYDHYKTPIMDNVSQIKTIPVDIIKNNDVQHVVSLPIISKVDTSTSSSQTETPTQNKLVYSQNNAVELEHNIHQQINNFRVKNGLKLLAYDEQLAIIAREHSKDMAVNNYYDHTSPNGVGLEDRYKNVNYVCFGWKGENIQIQNNDNNLVENAFQIWINSPEHKDNILFTNFMKEGIGVYFNGNDVYITEDFC